VEETYSIYSDKDFANVRYLGEGKLCGIGVGSEQLSQIEANLPLGWEDIKNLKSGTVTKTFMDDTMPNGPHESTIEYIGPFDKCNSEDDYNTVWAEFERRCSEVQ
jgi:hypothetical protein